jgi:hypothetical protein
MIADNIAPYVDRTLQELDVPWRSVSGQLPSALPSGAKLRIH